MQLSVPRTKQIHEYGQHAWTLGDLILHSCPSPKLPASLCPFIIHPPLHVYLSLFRAACSTLATMTKLIAALFLYFLPICLAVSKCYYPNGIEANDFSCDPDAEESVCCSGGLGTVCLSNKLCIGADGNTLRGSCTDKNWASPECAMFCLGK
jgi:hypothetical protein